MVSQKQLRQMFIALDNRSYLLSPMLCSALRLSSVLSWLTSGLGLLRCLTFSVFYSDKSNVSVFEGAEGCSIIANDKSC